jgi:hypothetical protein
VASNEDGVDSCRTLPATPVNEFVSRSARLGIVLVALACNSFLILASVVYWHVFSRFAKGAKVENLF